MRRRDLLTGLGVSAVTTPADAAGWRDRLFSRRIARRPLLIAGSSAMVELNTALVTDFSMHHPDIDAVIEAGSSLSALIALKRGSIDVAAMDRDVSEVEDEKGLRNYLIARDGIDIIVSAQSPIRAITSAQVREIFEGIVGDWSEIGWPKGTISVVAPARGTPARRFMEDNILDGGKILPSSATVETSAQLIETIAGNPNAVGFLLLNDRSISENVRLLPVDGIEASHATILSNRYPFTKSLYLALWNEDADSPGRLLVDFARGRRGREIIEAQQMIATT